MHVPFLLTHKLLLLNFLLLVWERENNGHQKVLTSSGIKKTWHFHLQLQLLYVSSGPRLSCCRWRGRGWHRAGSVTSRCRTNSQPANHTASTMPAPLLSCTDTLYSLWEADGRPAHAVHVQERNYLVSSSPFNLLTPRRSCHIINLEENNFSKLHLDKSTQ